jgi:hypothetical protein
LTKPISIVIAILCCFRLSAQDVEKVIADAKDVLNQDPVSIQGGIGTSFVFYSAQGIQSRRDPFYWALNGNLNITILNKISCPFSFTLTQQDKNFSNGLDKFSQPFNQFGISPTYKWLTVHAGYRSMEFSEYSLSGALFLGGGVEVKPKKGIISGSVAYGRFLKAIPVGGEQGVTVSLPAYARWGGAGKLRIGKAENHVELIYFRAADDENSIPFDTATHILPGENQIFGLVTKQKLGPSLNVEGSYHYSMYNPNTFLPIEKLERFTYVNKVFNPRANTRFNSAYSFHIDYDLAGYRIGAKFKRIDPDYTSLGSVFIVNDVQEISGNLSHQFLNGKLGVTVSLGVQENNLDRKQLATQRRIAGSGSVNISLIKNLNVNLSYNSFSSNVVALRDVFYDSIRLTQLSETATATANYTFGSKVRHSFMANATYQESGGNKQAPMFTFLFNPGYSVQFTKSNLGLVLNLSYTEMHNSVGELKNFGPTGGINHSIFKQKLKSGLNLSFQQSRANAVLTNQNYAATVFLQFSPAKSHSFKVNYAYIQKNAVVAGAQDFSEHRMTVNYNYTFGLSYKSIRSKLKPEVQ